MTTAMRQTESARTQRLALCEPLVRQPNAAIPARRLATTCIFVLLGLVLVGVGAIGVLLPGVPTTGPLLAASFCFTKSCPALERRLIRNRLFARYLCYLDGSAALPRETRAWAIASMWASIVLSCGVLSRTCDSPGYFIAATALAGMVGTVCIWRFRSSVHDFNSGPRGQR